MGVTTIGLDLAKNGFQVHGIDGDGKVLVRRQLRRSEVLKFFSRPAGMPGGNGSVWHGAPLGAGNRGAGPYGEAEAADAEAICEAVTRPTMRFVAVKTVDQ